MQQLAYFEYLKEFYPQYINHYTKRKKSKNFIVNEFSSHTEDSYRIEIQQKDIIAKRFLEQYINDLISKEVFPLFNKIEIETINQCNNTCMFCPVSVKHDVRKHMVMPMELYKKIIFELADLNYQDTINIFSNNEPLLDPFLIERLQFTREHLPSAYIFIYTNGLLLTPEKLMQILLYVDFIHINNYNTLPQLLPTHKDIQECLIQNHISENKAEIHLRNKNECLSTRCGNSPNRKKCAKLSSPCILPFSQIVIRPSGDVSFCCNDAYGEFTRGSVISNSLSDIWYGKSFKESRDSCIKGRLTQMPCSVCDMLFMPLACEKNQTKVVDI